MTDKSIVVARLGAEAWDRAVEKFREAKSISATNPVLGYTRLVAIRKELEEKVGRPLPNLIPELDRDSRGKEEQGEG